MDIKKTNFITINVKLTLQIMGKWYCIMVIQIITNEIKCVLKKRKNK